LALLPATLFAPFAFGPPLTIPFGFIYWALDYKPDPNWLNGPATNDWLNNMFNQDKTRKEGIFDPPSAIGQADCIVDLGLPPPALNASQQRKYFKDINQNTAPSIVAEVNAPDEPPQSRRYLDENSPTPDSTSPESQPDPTDPLPPGSVNYNPFGTSGGGSSGQGGF